MAEGHFGLNSNMGRTFKIHTQSELRGEIDHAAVEV